MGTNFEFICAGNSFIVTKEYIDKIAQISLGL